MVDVIRYAWNMKELKRLVKAANVFNLDWTVKTTLLGSSPEVDGYEIRVHIGDDEGDQDEEQGASMTEDVDELEKEATQLVMSQPTATGTKAEALEAMRYVSTLRTVNYADFLRAVIKQYLPAERQGAEAKHE